MKGMTGFIIKLGAATAAFLVFLWVAFRPDVVTVQRGYSGTGMELNVNTSVAEDLVELNQVPEPLPQLPAAGPKAGDAYQNVQVLGHLSVGQFNRLMASLVNWVSPEQGCNYCHIPGNMASDDIYTKVVSRRMLQMTQHINSKWKTHVAETGVTCYTCHRGNNVPQYIWFEEPEGPYEHPMRLGTQAGQNRPAPSAGLASLPADPFTPYLLEDHEIRVLGETPLPTGNRKSIKQGEWTYALMMHMSNSLGVNCTYCHNSRSVAMWNQSAPARSTAWYGIRMTRALNQAYLQPLQPVYPDYRLGPTGDAPKQNCATCHQGAYKPLLGAPMLEDYPSLAAPGPQAEAETASLE
jgi:photosynthetic reaction center cytochrome c subunit